MSSACAEAFLKEYSEELPQNLLLRYDPMELLSQNGHCKTYLLRAKSDGSLAVAKAYRQSDVPVKEDIFSKLSHPGLPAYLETIQDEKTAYVLRAYVPGETLEEYAKRPLSEKEAVQTAVSLCDILIYLGGMDPPVIHRDIKPSNIIRDGETGRLTLIDFSIARAYVKGAAGDTVCLGTQRFSPPEQFGFAQTDGRTDIYALGMLLLWLVTGDSDRTSGMRQVRQPGLRRIIAKSAAFDPDQRYQNPLKMKKALLRYEKRAVQKAALAAAAVLAAAALFLAGFAAGRYTSLRVPVFSNALDSAQALDIQDGALEKKVRAALNQPEGIITASQAASLKELNAGLSAPDAPGETKITDISALARFPGLRALNLEWNDIADISPLARLTNLTELRLNGNSEIYDFTPLSGLVRLRTLTLVACQITASNIAVLNGMEGLEELWVESFRLKDASFASHFSHLRRLELKNCGLTDISPLAGLGEVTDLGLEMNPIEDLSPLLKMPALTYVSLSEGMRAQAEEQLKDANFIINYQ